MVILKSGAIKKHYLSNHALRGVELELESGHIAGLLGPNGSGKTTFLKIVAGLIHASGGKITVCGNEIGYKTKSLVAYLPDSEFLYPWMKIADAEDTYRRLFADFDTKKFAELLDFMKLTPDLKFKSLSRGMKEKLALTLTLSRNAKLFVLDEPLAGVDPIARDQILGAILKGFSPDSAMLITSHMINEFETIFDTVFYLKDGKIVLCGEAEKLKEEKGQSLDEIYREVFAQ